MIMKTKIKKAFVGVVTAIITWLLLSYVFFPVKLAAPANEYFIATITHMVPLKTTITLLFVVTILFLYEQWGKKDKNK